MEMFRDLVEHSPEIIQSIDPDGRYLHVNESWRSTLGYTNEEARKLSVFEVIAPDHHEQCLRRMEQVFKGATVRDIETSFIDREGRRIDVIGSISCRMAEGRPVATNAVFSLADSLGRAGDKADAGPHGGLQLVRCDQAAGRELGIRQHPPDAQASGNRLPRTLRRLREQGAGRP